MISLLWNLFQILFPISPDTAIRFMLPLMLLSFVISAFTELALINGFSALIQNTPVSPKTLIIQAFAKLPRFLIIFILWVVIMLIGISFLVVPAIIFATWFMFVGTIVMLEQWPGIIGIFQRSKYLVSNNFFPLLLRVATVMLGTIIVIYMANKGFLSTIALLTPGATPAPLNLIASFFGPILSALILPVITGTIVVLYYEIKKTKG